MSHGRPRVTRVLGDLMSYDITEADKRKSLAPRPGPYWVTATATGASLTGVTVMVSVPTAVAVPSVTV